VRILICTNCYPPRFVGGAELVAHDQARTLMALGHEVRVFSGDLGTAQSRHSRNDDVFDGIIVHRIATVPEDYSPDYLNFFHPQVDLHFRDVIATFRPDIVHTHNLIGLSAKLPIIARQFGARTVCTLHDFWSFCLRNTAMRPDGTACIDVTACRQTCQSHIHEGHGWHIPLRYRQDFIKLAMAHIDHFIAPSQFVAKQHILAGIVQEKISVIANGIDLDRFNLAPPTGEAEGDTVQIMFVGYMGPHKGLMVLIDAFAQMSETINCEVRLTLAGDGHETPLYRERVATLGLAKKIHFLGKVNPEQMPALYRASDIVVLASVWGENQPVCLMEAMAAGLPVVASRVGGIPEIVADDETGLLFEAGNATDLKDKLTKLCFDSGRRRAMGRQARDHMKQLSLQHQTQQLVALYDSCLRQSLAPVWPHTVQAVVGPLNDKELAGDKLDPHINPQRLYVPTAWITDCAPRFAGVLLSGTVRKRMWRWHLPVRYAIMVPLRSVVSAIICQFIRMRIGAIRIKRDNTDRGGGL